MNDFISLAGRDISPLTQNIRIDEVPRLKTVVISVMKEGGDVEYTIIPLGPSYLEAVAMAFEALGDHLGDLAPDSVCLKMAAKNFNGETVWASILPVLWNEIIAGGTELRLFSKSTPTIPPQATEFSKRIYIERPTVTIKISKSSAKDDHSRYVTILLPKSYNETRKQAFDILGRYFKKDKSSWEQTILRGLIEEETNEGTVFFKTFISAYGMGECLEWEHLIIQMKKEYPHFKVLIF
ncbi:hypothetical protein BJ912DRAFT_966028 [Pholiota molesta]|nr:hypothetical protein BJ912DRAFT_966028 [Pholiota molesta]